MTWATIGWFALVLICPISMIFMMRGMGGMGGMRGGKGMSHDMTGTPAPDAAKDRRLADLEQEVAELRASHNEQRFIETHKR